MFDMDAVVTLGAIGTAWLSRFFDYRVWKPGDRLRILLVGYNGKRNTGADVRVAAMVEQFYQLLGRDRVHIGVLTFNQDKVKGYFGPDTELIHCDSIFFEDVLRACSQYHVTVLSEGSTLKSKFANSLTLIYCEAAGIMRRQRKPCLAYGSEAGYMDPLVRHVAARLCKDTYFIARTEPSLRLIGELGLKGHVGTDTAWIFPPGPKDWVLRTLREKTGWDGRQPLLGVAVINPFCWPVRPSLTRLLKASVCRRFEDHYDKWYFFTSSKQRRALYRRYIAGLAEGLRWFASSHHAHVVLIGMEALDIGPCSDLRAEIGGDVPILGSDVYDGYQLTGVLQALDGLVTSRYHARVLSMTAGVPGIAVSMDERLYNLFQECGHLEDYYVPTEEPRLGERLHVALERLWEERHVMRAQLRRAVPDYVRRVGEMGLFFRNWLECAFPGVALCEAPTCWQKALPPLHAELSALLQRDGGSWPSTE